MKGFSGKYRRIKRGILLFIICILNLSVLPTTGALIILFSWWCILYPFAYMITFAFIIDKLGYNRNVRTPKQIEFDNENTCLGTNYYLSETYYRNKKTGEIFRG